jgi:hypothetical protein
MIAAAAPSPAEAGGVAKSGAAGDTCRGRGRCSDPDVTLALDVGLRAS